MGLQHSSEQPYCPKGFNCWPAQDNHSPLKQIGEQPYFFQLNIEDLLLSNRQKQNHINFEQVSSFQYERQGRNKIKKIGQNSNTINVSSQNKSKLLKTDNKIRFNDNYCKKYETIDTNEGTLFSLIDSKDNQLISKLKFSSNKNQLQSILIPQFSNHPSFSSQNNKLLSFDSQSFILQQNSKFARTPITQKWNHFVYTSNRSKYQKSNQNQNSNIILYSTPCNQQINLHTNPNLILQTNISNGFHQKVLKNGDIIIGFFHNNICNGKCQYIKKDGSFYQGQFIDNQASGYGIYKSSEGFKYQGYWKESIPNGKGKFIYSDHSYYEGEILLGKRHGNGILQKNGTRYQGTFLNDRIQGRAKMITDNGQIYDGTWKQDLFHGEGQYKWPNGDNYIGSYKKGKRDGFGIMRYQNGDIYEGYWRNGMKDGQGKLIEGGLVRYGKWIRGQYIENLY